MFGFVGINVPATRSMAGGRDALEPQRRTKRRRRSHEDSRSVGVSSGEDNASDASSSNASNVATAIPDGLNEGSGNNLGADGVIGPGAPFGSIGSLRSPFFWPSGGEVPRAPSASPPPLKSSITDLSGPHHLGVSTAASLSLSFQTLGGGCTTAFGVPGLPAIQLTGGQGPGAEDIPTSAHSRRRTYPPMRRGPSLMSNILRQHSLDGISSRRASDISNVSSTDRRASDANNISIGSDRSSGVDYNFGSGERVGIETVMKSANLERRGDGTTGGVVTTPESRQQLRRGKVSKNGRLQPNEETAREREGVEVAPKVTVPGRTFYRNLVCSPEIQFGKVVELPEPTPRGTEKVCIL